MRDVSLQDRAGLPPGRLATLQAAVAGQRTLADVLSWARTQRPPAEVVEIVTQDEYTHDAVLAVGGADDQVYLAYDTT